MARPKSVTIKLTPTQRRQVKKVTGEDHDELRLERGGTKRREPLSAKVAPKKFAQRGVEPRLTPKKFAQRGVEPRLTPKKFAQRGVEPRLTPKKTGGGFGGNPILKP